MTASISPRFAGSISEGTLRTEDLLPRFIAVLRVADVKHPLVIEWEGYVIALNTLAELLDTTPPNLAEDIGFWDAEHLQYLLNEQVFDALNEVAPEGTYFGASEGDGASFGFWPIDECPEYGHPTREGNVLCYYCTPDPAPGQEDN
jgi:hypothetical protein